MSAEQIGPMPGGLHPLIGAAPRSSTPGPPEANGRGRRFAYRLRAANWGGLHRQDHCERDDGKA